MSAFVPTSAPKLRKKFFVRLYKNLFLYLMYFPVALYYIVWRSRCIHCGGRSFATSFRYGLFHSSNGEIPQAVWILSEISGADAGYGSFNNYLYCQEHGMEKFMKFPMYKKETTDEKYRTHPFRAVNFKTDPDGDLACPNNKKFRFAYRKDVKGNRYGRQEEVYICEDCSACPYAAECKKTDKNRTIRLNQELTAMHREVLNNPESIHGALLRMNRSIQAEGTFAILKNDRWYKRVVRRGLDSVRLELLLVSVGHNLYKFHNKQKKLRAAA